MGVLTEELLKIVDAVSPGKLKNLAEYDKAVLDFET